MFQLWCDVMKMTKFLFRGGEKVKMFPKTWYIWFTCACLQEVTNSLKTFFLSLQFLQVSPLSNFPCPSINSILIKVGMLSLWFDYSGDDDWLIRYDDRIGWLIVSKSKLRNSYNPIYFFVSFKLTHLAIAPKQIT